MKLSAPHSKPLEDILRIGKRGEEDDGDVPEVRIVLDALAEGVAIHLRHVDIRDDEIGRAGGDPPSASRPLRALTIAMPVLLQDVLEFQRLGGAVLDDDDIEDARGVRGRGRRQSWPGVLDALEQHGDLGPLRRAVFNADAAAVQLDDFAGHGETEADALAGGFGAEKGIENAAQVFRAEAGAGIAEG